jgi:anti-anti-sigma regulatory factor
VSFSITPSDKGDYIIMEVHGEMDRNLDLQMDEEAQSVEDQLNIHKFLVDVTDSVNVDSILD